MVTSNFDKFRLLLWKNWVLQWNHKLQFGVEMILPAIFSLLLVLVRTLVSPEYSDEKVYNQTLPIDNLYLFKPYNTSSSPDGFKNLAYSPNLNSVFEDIVKDAADSLNLTHSGYASAKDMEDALMEGNFLGGVHFEDLTNSENLSYQIRLPSELRSSPPTSLKTWMTNMLFLPFDPNGPRNKEDEDGGIPVGYLREGFLPVQNAISTAFLKRSAKNFKDQELPRVVLQRYPYPQYTDDPLLSGLASTMSFIILLSYIYPCICTVKYITTEKEKQLKEVMKIMGLQNWLHWTAWFVKGFLMMGFSSLLITIVLMVKWTDGVGVLTQSSFTAVFFFFLIYTITTIAFCFMLATLFSKASTAAAVTGLIWFILYIPFLFFQFNYEALTLTTKLLWSLLCNTAMGFGIRVIISFETDGQGLQWSNMFLSVSVDDSLSMAHVLALMLLSSCIYIIICLYLEQVYPGEFGVPKKWYFPFTKRFWCEEPEYLGVEDSCNGTKRDNPSSFEVEPKGKHVGLQIKNLTKVFGQRKAVKGLSLNMYEDEITVLLGHNGAGKTTTISMLTGMFPPSSGTAVINGSDIRTNIDGARMSLGICPQHNILFDDLTVRDHLVFYSRLKGLKGEALEAEVKRYIKKIDLENKANVASSKLSGGMKRKLSVCAAFCGGTKVVLCDEPSSGMDPAARRQLWDLLQSEKIGRTILLTTHFMDEADVLGDRIAIMSDGELKCMGTSFFLKKKYGNGYRLICVKKKDCDAEEVTKLLSKYIPDLKPEADIGAELSYQLPDKYSTHFEKMFHDLETQSDELSLNGYGVSITSLEEVFMKVGAEKPMATTVAPLKPIMNGNGFGSDDGESMNSDNMFSDNQRLLKGHNLIVSQWRSMIMKKFLFTLRNKLLFAIQNLMPILFVTMTILVATKSSYSTLRPMTMGIHQYPTTVTVLETTSKVVDGSLEANISANYKQIIDSYSSNHKLQQTGSEGFIKYMLELGKTLQVRINSRYIAAATVDAGTITAWLNNKPLHSAPLTVNLIHNAMAKALIGPNASISITNAPLPYSQDSTFQHLNTVQNVGTQLSLNLCFCMCFVSALYVMFLIKENQSRAKLLQFVGGVKVIIFWLSHFVWDYVTFTLTSVTVIITLACFQEEGYVSFDELGRNFAMLLLFGCSVLPFTYLIAGIFSEPSTGLAKLSIINIFCGNAFFIIIVLMKSKIFGTQEIADFLEKIFLAFPHFSLAQGLNKLYLNAQIRKICLSIPEEDRCSKQCCPLHPFFTWDDPGVLREVTYLATTSIVFSFILILKEYRIMDNLFFKIQERTTRRPLSPPENGYFDEDVEQEKIRIANMSSSEIVVQNLVLDRVTKFYGRFVAVNQISVGVKHSECFGLLGVNGAGKTTTFKMLTGDERISSGDGYVKGLSLKTDMNAVYQEIGYCPQFDALFDDFTGRETLKIFALLRGIPDSKILQVSSDLAKSFGFMQHYNKQVRAYSGGNKRKLSTAIAVMGSPSVVYLDEPTTGMDPAARRQLWNMICRIRDAGKSIVLTSHSMEECEALCTRLAIMVNGEYKCIGSTQHLKNKFTKGLILKIKLKKGTENASMELMDGDSQNVMNFIKAEFTEAVLQERFQGILTFYIPLSSILWSRIFGLMESNKVALNIEDYSISQTTLEEIFLQFAKYQTDDPRELQ